MITNNIDLPSESQIFGEKEKENNNEYDQVLEVFDFIIVFLHLFQPEK